MVHIDDIAKWLRKTEGRDKVCKILQYVCRLLAAHQRGRNDYYQLMFYSLFQSIRQARKLFRLFKSIDQYQSVVHLVFYGEEELLTLFHIATKSLYFFYWVFDNISVAAKVKLFNLDSQRYHKVGVRIRLAALLLSVAIYFYEVRYKNHTPEQRQSLDLKAAKNVFDLFPAGKDSGLAIGLGERVASIGGLISALISTYQIYIEQ